MAPDAGSPAAQGPVTVGDGLTLADVWTSLHASAEAWQRAAEDADLQARIDESDLSIMQTLCEVPAVRWHGLCDALGWTPYGSAALSWCAGADIDAVRDTWEATGTVLTPDPVVRRPARFLNPALIPASRKLSDLVRAGAGSNLQICLFIAARAEPVEIDLPRETLHGAAPQLTDFLRVGLQHRATPAPEDADLVSLFSAIAEGGGPYS